MAGMNEIVGVFEPLPGAFKRRVTFDEGMNTVHYTYGAAAYDRRCVDDEIEEENTARLVARMGV